MKLYHYTDLNGLKGIIESNSLRATSLQFLNDSEELTHGIECISKALPRFRGNIPADQIDSIQKAMERYSRRYLKNAYSVSFCREAELLSQWRGYANKHGVCIQFDSNKLLNALNLSESECVYDDVIYCEKGNPLKAETQLTKLFESFERRHSNFINDGLQKMSAMRFASRRTPFFKNDRFREEQEYRIVVYPYMGFQEVNFRVSEKGLIPFIELKTKPSGIDGNGNMTFERIPIEKVTVAPCSNAEFIKDGIMRFLDYHFYRDTVVDTSLTPYRG
jgi:hypothetical protein